MPSRGQWRCPVVSFSAKTAGMPRGSDVALCVQGEGCLPPFSYFTVCACFDQGGLTPIPRSRNRSAPFPLCSPAGLPTSGASASPYLKFAMASHHPPNSPSSDSYHLGWSWRWKTRIPELKAQGSISHMREWCSLSVGSIHFSSSGDHSNSGE